MPECELQALIAELEQAEEGSRELDTRIVTATGRKVERFMVPKDHPVLQGGLEFLVEEDGRRTGIPPYTTSIDAALPGEDDLFWVIERWPEMDWRAQALDSEMQLIAEVWGKTEPLARRIAALKARESLRAREAGR